MKPRHELTLTDIDHTLRALKTIVTDDPREECKDMAIKAALRVLRARLALQMGCEEIAVAQMAYAQLIYAEMPE